MKFLRAFVAEKHCHAHPHCVGAIFCSGCLDAGLTATEVASRNKRMQELTQASPLTMSAMKASTLQHVDFSQLEAAFRQQTKYGLRQYRSDENEEHLVTLDQLFKALRTACVERSAAMTLAKGYFKLVKTPTSQVVSYKGFIEQYARKQLFHSLRILQWHTSPGWIRASDQNGEIDIEQVRVAFTRTLGGARGEKEAADLCRTFGKDIDDNPHVCWKQLLVWYLQRQQTMKMRQCSERSRLQAKLSDCRLGYGVQPGKKIGPSLVSRDSVLLQDSARKTHARIMAGREVSGSKHVFSTNLLAWTQHSADRMHDNENSKYSNGHESNDPYLQMDPLTQRSRSTSALASQLEAPTHSSSSSSALAVRRGQRGEQQHQPNHQRHYRSTAANEGLRASTKLSASFISVSNYVPYRSAPMVNGSMDGNKHYTSGGKASKLDAGLKIRVDRVGGGNDDDDDKNFNNNDNDNDSDNENGNDNGHQNGITNASTSVLYSVLSKETTRKNTMQHSHSESLLNIREHGKLRRRPLSATSRAHPSSHQDHRRNNDSENEHEQENSAHPHPTGRKKERPEQKGKGETQEKAEGATRITEGGTNPPLHVHEHRQRRHHSVMARVTPRQSRPQTANTVNDLSTPRRREGSAYHDVKIDQDIDIRLKSNLVVQDDNYDKYYKPSSPFRRLSLPARLSKKKQKRQMGQKGTALESIPSPRIIDDGNGHIDSIIETHSYAQAQGLSHSHSMRSLGDQHHRHRYHHLHHPHHEHNLSEGTGRAFSAKSFITKPVIHKHASKTYSRPQSAQMRLAHSFSPRPSSTSPSFSTQEKKTKKKRPSIMGDKPARAITRPSSALSYTTTSLTHAPKQYSHESNHAHAHAHTLAQSSFIQQSLSSVDLHAQPKHRLRPSSSYAVLQRSPTTHDDHRHDLYHTDDIESNHPDSASAAIATPLTSLHASAQSRPRILSHSRSAILMVSGKKNRQRPSSSGIYRQRTRQLKEQGKRREGLKATMVRENSALTPASLLQLDSQYPHAKHGYADLGGSTHQHLSRHNAQASFLADEQQQYRERIAIMQRQRQLQSQEYLTMQRTGAARQHSQHGAQQHTNHYQHHRLQTKRHTAKRRPRSAFATVM